MIFQISDQVFKFQDAVHILMNMFNLKNLILI